MTLFQMKNPKRLSKDWAAVPPMVDREIILPPVYKLKEKPLWVNLMGALGDLIHDLMTLLQHWGQIKQCRWAVLNVEMIPNIAEKARSWIADPEEHLERLTVELDKLQEGWAHAFTERIQGIKKISIDYWEPTQ
jgi:hypothetical protein